MRYFFHDFETGGFENTSILTFYGLLTDKKFNKIDDIEFSIKPESGLYLVDPEALKINKINLVEHFATAEDKSSCKRRLRDFIMRATAFGTKKVYPAGHNVYFDNQLLKTHFFSEDYGDLFFRHNFDTGTLAVLLKTIGKLPEDFSVSLSNLATHYKIDSSGAHQSKSDVLLTVAVLKCMMEELKGHSGQRPLGGAIL